MSDFTNSTQRIRWLLSPEDLNRRRHESNSRAWMSLRKWGSSKTEFSPGSILTPEDVENGEHLKKDNPLSEGLGINEEFKPSLEPLTPEDEIKYVRFYEVRLQQVCFAFKFPSKVLSSAHHYFKRFFLQWSVLEMDVKQIMLSCIFLACKIEDSYISAQSLADGVKQDRNTVLAAELQVLKALDFDLITFGPYRSATAFILIFEEYLSSLNIQWSSHLSDKLTSEVSQHLHKTFLTDIPLLFSPAQIALFSVWHVINAWKTQFNFDPFVFLEEVNKRASHGRHTEVLTQVFDQISAIMNESGGIPSDQVVKSLDKRIRFCKNPSRAAEDKKKKLKKGKQKVRESHSLEEGDQESKRRRSVEMGETGKQN